MHNAWTRTMLKLEAALKNLEKFLENADSDNTNNAYHSIAAFRDYKDCNYCQMYRTVLKEHVQNCCKSCPLHKYGEKMVGREISYNGCYKIASYREVVRTSWKFCVFPNELDAKYLITNIKECMNQMTIHRSEVEF